MPKLFLFPKNEIASLRERRLIFEVGKIESETSDGGRKEMRDGIREISDPDSEIESLKKDVEDLETELDDANKKANTALTELTSKDVDENYIATLQKRNTVAQKYFDAKEELKIAEKATEKTE